MKITKIGADINSQAQIAEANYCRKAILVNGEKANETSETEAVTEGGTTASAETKEAQEATKKNRKTKRVQSEEV